MAGTASSGTAVGGRKRGAPLTREWLFESVDTVPEAGCWIWRGGPDGQGYGTVCAGAKGAYKKAHRVSHELYKGEIPAGLVVMHKCDTPLCVNPDHLCVGTRGDNNRDRRMKGRCSQKLRAEQVLAIFRDGRSQALIASEYGVDPSTVNNIKSGKRRSHITGIRKESVL